MSNIRGQIDPELGWISDVVTLRDQFAMAALTGLCAWGGNASWIPGKAFDMADAMLAERERQS